ncbi:nucleotidyltransferase family protein [Thermococcus sp.]
MEDLIKKSILKICKKYNIKPVKIILFGSQARGNAKSWSDWDFEYQTRLKISGEIRRILAKYGIATDLLFISNSQLKKLRNDKGYIYYYALKEGKPL